MFFFVLGSNSASFLWVHERESGYKEQVPFSCDVHFYCASHATNILTSGCPCYKIIAAVASKICLLYSELAN